MRYTHRVDADRYLGRVYLLADGGDEPVNVRVARVDSGGRLVTLTPIDRRTILRHNTVGARDFLVAVREGILTEQPIA